MAFLFTFHTGPWSTCEHWLFSSPNRIEKKAGIVLIISCSYWNKRSKEREQVREKKYKEKQMRSV
jgi:hypothetical protein